MKVNDIIVFGRLGKCRVLILHGAGTVDVERLSDGKCFRVTGL